jgi:hypothetical protein
MLRNSSVRGPGFIGVALLLFGAGCSDGVADDLESGEVAALTDNALTTNALTTNALTTNALTTNALTTNALTTNALTTNALTTNALTTNALTTNALTTNALTTNALRDPLARELMKYVISCALDEKDSISLKIDGKRYKFDGQLGLATEWGERDGSCDGSCQRWVSACVLARVDAKGIELPISVRGAHRALLPTWKELRDYTYREASYYGNLFTKGQPKYLCLAPGRTSDKRVCGESLANCPMTVTGACDDVCEDEGWFGAFNDCSDARRNGRTYEEVITVFLQR